MTDLSRQGAGAVLGYEGLYLYAYPDPGTGGEPITIGGGHTAAAGGLKPKLGMTISLAKALEIFMEDMKKYGARVDLAIRRDKSQHVFDGFTSFDFNTGAIYSGSVDEKWNAGDKTGALAVLGRYVNAGGKRMQGLANRRASETAIIRDGVYPKTSVLVRTAKGAKPQSIHPDRLPWPGLPGPNVTAIIPEISLPARKEADNFLVRLAQSVWSYLK